MLYPTPYIVPTAPRKSGPPVTKHAPAGAASASDAGDAWTIPAQPVPPAPDTVPAALADVLTSLGAVPIPTPADVAAAAAAAVAGRGLDSTFAVVDVGALSRLHTAWRRALPRVTPFYAVKCNPDPGLLRVLAALGAGFDCASAAELDLVLGLGVPTARVVYAHPCKPPPELRHARNLGVGLTTFDTGGEVDKLAAHHPSCRALLRLRFDVATAQCSLGAKYGCQPEAAAGLLEHAARRGIAVVGVAFHIGSNAHDPATYGRAVAAARVAFDAGAAAGHVMTVLDVGGGFAGGDPADMLGGLGPTVAALNAALAAHFPPSSGVRVIAEPGRYFATHAMTLACAINGVRVRGDGGAEGGEGGGGVDYWLSDGIYGGFNSIVYDTARPTFFPLKLGGGGGGEASAAPDAAPLQCDPTVLAPSTLFGPTCDGADVVASDVLLPRLAVGDYVLSAGAGAYTLAAASAFNGFDARSAPRVYVWSQAAA